MKIKQCIIMSVLSVFCLSASLFAADLKIETGKEEIVRFKGDSRQLFNDQVVYDNVTIGAGTKVYLDNEFQYVAVSTSEKTDYRLEERYIGSRDPVTGEVTVTSVSVSIAEITVDHNYRRDEQIATLGISKTGTLTLNAGSELGIRNEYNLVISTQDASLETYKSGTKRDGGEDIISIRNGAFSNELNALDGGNRNLAALSSYGAISPNNLFTGDIVFQAGDAATILSFLPVSINPAEAPHKIPEMPDDLHLVSASSMSEVYTKNQVQEIPAGELNNDVARLSNNFIINSNNAVLNVIGEKQNFAYLPEDPRAVVLTGKFSGDGTVVKTGGGAMYLYESTRAANALDLTGNNTGFAWKIEDGWLISSGQNQLGKGNVFISSQGTLGLNGTVAYENKIVLDSGGISLGGGSLIELTGQIVTGDSGNARLALGGGGAGLILTGDNDAKIFNIDFWDDGNFLRSNAAGLASDVITAEGHFWDTDRNPNFRDFTLEINESSDAEYKGSLQGEMYLRKTGAGTLTLSGTSTYEKGTFISEGGIAITNAYSLGTPDAADPNKGKIMFDSSSTSKFASLQVVEAASGSIDLYNNIHINKGAVFNVFANQKLTLFGDIVKYDSRPGYDAAFFKEGFGLMEIGNNVISPTRNVNISTFNVNAGGFRLAENVVLKSSFELNDESSYLEMAQGAGVSNIININKGDLRIFNDKNISSATVNFLNTSTSSMSNFYIASTTVMSAASMSKAITISSGINFINDATVTMYSNVVNFSGGANTVVHKSGAGNLIYSSTAPSFLNFAELSVYDGRFTVVNSTASISNVVVDGGILIISSGAYLTSPQSEVTILTGGFGIYDHRSIDENILLNFAGTDSNNLATLVVEANNATLSNNIFVKTGVIVENANNLTIAGDSINFDSASSGIFAKSGLGTMTIAQSVGASSFNMGELRVLEGLLDATTDVNVNRLTLSGANTGSALMAISNNSIVNAGNVNISNAMLTVNTGSDLKSNSMNVNGGGLVQGVGKISGVVNFNNGSYLRTGTSMSAPSETDRGDGVYADMELDSVNFNSGSTFIVDVYSSGGMQENDMLVVRNNTMIGNNVNLQVDARGDDYSTQKTFQIIQTGSLAYNPGSVFNIDVNGSARLVSSIYVNESHRGVFLNILEKWSSYVIDIPGATKNQQAMINVLNDLDNVAGGGSNFRKEVLDLVDSAYAEYNDHLNSAPFLAITSDLSGIMYANTFEASLMSSKANIIYSVLSSKDTLSSNRNIWAQVYTNSNNIKASEGSPEFENSISGIIAGYDAVTADNMVFGFAGFYGAGQFKQLQDSADITDLGVNAYTNYDYEKFVVRGVAGLTFRDHKSSRSLQTINNSRIESDYAVNVINIDVEGAYKYDLTEYFILKPLVGINFAVAMNDAITEKGSAAYRLKIDASNFTKAEIRAGAGLQSNSGSKLNWYVNLVAKQLVGDAKGTMTASFAEMPGQKFEIEGTALAKTVFSGNVGCQYGLNNNISLFVDLSSDMASNASAFLGNIGASYRW
ncbi:MAG: autotransporter domain-containing protein [Endomicrobium sp.]|jgi:autotransporter-associated beta strand protein|nr:autotransporter domain-containing protein [Endomicrobium sp.]